MSGIDLGGQMGWESAGAAWGAKGWDWAMYQEPVHANSYDVLQAAVGAGPGKRLLDIACGSGLALQRAAAKGARVSGVDAAANLIAIAAQRVPGADLRVGDMDALPFAADEFDIVTSTNGMQYGTPGALAEATRVLRPGGLLGIAFWRDHGDFAEHFALVGRLSPPRPNTPPTPSLGDPGVAAEVLDALRLDLVEHGEHSMIGIYRNAADAFSGMASSGPAWAAIDHSGPDAFESGMSEFLAKHTDPESGRVRLAATATHVIARKRG